MNRITQLILIAAAAIALTSCNDKPSQAESTASPEPMVMGDAVPAPPQDDSYRIEVEVANYPGDTALLAVRYGDSNRLRDTALVTDGKFVFEGDTALAAGIYMVVLRPRNTFFEIVVDRDQHFKIMTDTTDLVMNFRSEGSPENELMYKDIHLLASLRPKADSLRRLYQEAPEGSDRRSNLEAQLAELDTTVVRHRRQITQQYRDWFYGKFLYTMKNPEIPPSITDREQQYYYYKSHFFDNVDLTDERLLRSVALHEKVFTYLDQLTPRDPDSINASIDRIVDVAEQNDEVFKYLVPTILNKYIESKMMGYDGVYVHMVEKYYLSGKAFWVDGETLEKMEERALALSPNLIGRQAPDFAAESLTGQTKSLHSMPGDWTILYFWDYDCSHCKKVTPELARMYDQFKDKGVSLFTVNINGTQERWREQIANYGFTGGTHTSDPRRSSGFDALYDIRSTPRVFILDENKVIRYKSLSVEQIEGVLNHELGLDEAE